MCCGIIKVHCDKEDALLRHKGEHAVAAVRRVHRNQVAADKVAKLIDDIYVQERTDKTDEQCKEAKEAWDALTDAQKEYSKKHDVLLSFQRSFTLQRLIF